MSSESVWLPNGRIAMDLGGFLRITFWTLSSLFLINGSLAPHPHKKIKLITKAIHIPFPLSDIILAIISTKMIPPFIN
jgi:hypothetical protein